MVTYFILWHESVTDNPVKANDLCSKAVYWTEKALSQGIYQQAASEGNSDAQSSLACIYDRLGRFYYEGLGVTKNMQKAIAYFEKGANLGHFTSMYLLARIYETGDGVPKDAEKAAYWKKKYEEE